MSLQIWLPLTKDLRQQGIASSTQTTTGTININSSGKLGGCGTFTGSQKIINTLSTAVTSSIGSLACWVKMNSLPGSSSFYNLLQVGTLGGYANCRLGLYMEYTNKINISIDGSSTGANVYTHSLSANVWYHICATYDGTTAKLYINGEQVLSKTASKGSYTTAASAVYIGGTSSYYLNGYMNDARYYDHCLSPMEVKELAKGLVLHYPLSDKSIESTTNLNTKVNMNNSTNSVWGGHSTTTTTYDCTNEPVPFNSGNKIEITYPVGNSTDGGTSVNLGVSIPVASSTVYTLSVYLKASDNFSYWTNNFIYYYGDSSGHGIFNINNKEYIGNGWYRIWGTLTTGSSQTSLNPYFYSYPGTNKTYYIGGWQLEQKDHMTPFVSFGTNRDNSTVYDCSGFCNNGTITGTLTCSSDTPKYNVSTVFNGSSCIDTNINYLGNEWSYGGWIYSATSSRSWEGVLMLNGTNPADADLQFGFYTCPKSNIIQNSANGKYNSSISWAYGTWHHFMGTYDGATLKTYIDGVLVNSTGITQAFLERHNFVIGARHSSGTNHDCYFLGNISDVRIYATTLSASDVKSLYQNSAYIDSSGNVYGTVHTEV